MGNRLYIYAYIKQSINANRISQKKRKMKYQSYGFLLLIGISFLTSCIKDDFVDDAVDPILTIRNQVDFIVLGETHQFEYRYLNNVGVDEEVNIQWQSSATEIISISETGLTQSHKEGTAVITVSYLDGDVLLEDTSEIEVKLSDEENEEEEENENEEEEEEEEEMEGIVRTGSIVASSFYDLEGDFTLSENGSELLLEFSSNYLASSALPGLYVYLSNNPNTIANAFEIGAVEVFEGAHSYEIADIPIDEYNYVLYFCKPFNVKVGDGEIQ